MRPSGKVLVRLLVVFIRLFPAAVAIGGVWHIVALVQHLSRPMYNLRMTYQGENERAVVLASQAHFDFSKGVLFARGVSLRDPQGREITSVREVTANLALPWTGRPATVVTLKDGSIDLIRLEDGSWELKRFLPRRPEEKPSEAPFEVRAENIRVRLIDRASSGAPVWVGRVPHAFAAGYSDNMTGKGLVEVSGVGTLHTTVDIRGGRLSTLEISTDGADLNELLSYAKRMHELTEVTDLHNISAASGRFAGTVSIWHAPDLRWSVFGNLEAREVAYQSYKASEARFDGLISWAGMQGQFNARLRGGSVSGDVTTNWDEKSALARVDVRASDAKVLTTMGIRLPEGVEFGNASWSGIIAWRNALAFHGEINVKTLRWQDLEASNVKATLASNGSKLRIANATAHVSGGKGQGELSVSLEDKQPIQGLITLSEIELTRLPKLPEEIAKYLVAGKADAGLVLSGTLAEPAVEVRASGVAEVLAQGEQYAVVDHPAFSLSGAYRKGQFIIEDARATARSGSLFATGAISINKRTLDLNIRADALDLLLYPDSPASGTAFASLKVEGSLDQPHIAGVVEAYNINVSGITVPIARFDAEHTLGGPIDLHNIMVRQGPSEASGSLRLAETREGWTLEGEGTFENVTLDSFVAADVAGIATGAWAISGRAEDPDIRAHLEAKTLFLGDVAVENVRAEGRWFGRTAYLSAFTANFGSGTVSASGSYALDNESSIQINGESLDLSTLSHFISDTIAFSGSANLTGEVRFLDGELTEAKGVADIASLAMNNEPIGAGSLEVRYAEDRVIASGSIGSLEGYFILDETWYQVSTGEYSAQVNVLNVPSESLYNLTQRYLPPLEPQIADLLQNSRGWLTASLAASGNASPAAEEGEVAQRVRDGSFAFELSDLEVRGEPLGNLRSKVTKEGFLWKILDFSWTDGPIEGRLLPSSTNTITEDGDLSLEVEFLNADLSVLNRLFPGTVFLSGRGDLTVVFSGPTQSPHGTASLSVDELKIGDLPPLDLTVAGISIMDGAIEVRASEGAGLANLRSFAARLEEARIPFRYPFEFPDEPIYARVVVPERNLNAVSEFFGGLDTEATVGQIHEGEVVVTGTLENPQIRGAIRATADTLAFQGLDQVLHNVDASLTLDGLLTHLTFTAFDHEGGSLQLEGGVNLESLELLPTTLRAENFRVRQEVGDRNTFSGVLTGEVRAEGTWLEPTVIGSLTAREGFVALRGDFPERTAQGPLAFNPRLSLNLLAERSEVRSGPLDALFIGSGSVTGTLEQPQVRAEFRMLGGTLRLPTADLRFTEGSRAVLTYAPEGGFDEKARLDVALNATTRITAHNGISVQRYTINLNISGDALADEDLNIIATSDPPDLTRDQILAILGQQQLLEGVAGAAVGGFNTQLTDTLASVLAPVLARSVTRSLERSLGLDYLSFDIQPGSATSVTLAKALGSGFALEYRRTLEEFEESGVPLEEIGLSYSPRVRNPILGRIRLSIVAERGGILRLSVGYSRRF